MLSGQCKQDFEKWFMKTYLGYSDPRAIEIEKRAELNLFYAYDFSMQYGVYVDFFDSCNISIKCGDVTFEIYMPDSDLEGIAVERTEARTKAIEKANEIYNESKTI